VNFSPSFLDDDFRARAEAATHGEGARAARAAAGAREAADPGRASLAMMHALARVARALRPVPGVLRVADHVVHMIDVAGEEHVGLGSDFDGILAVPAGLEDAARLPRLADALAARGVPSRVVDKVFARNWLRVLDETA